MSDNIDHAAKARLGIDPEVWRKEGASNDALPTLIGVAQVHATLALVAATEKVAEQQRIANLITYLEIASVHRGGYDDSTLALERRVAGWLGLS